MTSFAFVSTFTHPSPSYLSSFLTNQNPAVKTWIPTSKGTISAAKPAIIRMLRTGCSSGGGCFNQNGFGFRMDFDSPFFNPRAAAKYYNSGARDSNAAAASAVADAAAMLWNPWVRNMLQIMENEFGVKVTTTEQQQQYQQQENPQQRNQDKEAQRNGPASSTPPNTAQKATTTTNESSPFSSSVPASDAVTFRSTRAPRWDFTESISAYTILVEVPGIRPADICVQIKAGTLYFHAKNSLNVEFFDQEQATIGVASASPWKYAETNQLRGADLKRSWNLPKDIAAEKITASTKDGLLTIRIPKMIKEEPKTLDIPIQLDSNQVQLQVGQKQNDQDSKSGNENTTQSSSTSDDNDIGDS